MTDNEREALTGDPRDLTSREVVEAMRDIENARLVGQSPDREDES